MTELTTVYTAIPVPSDATPDSRPALAAFIKENFIPRVNIAGVLVSGNIRQIHITVEMESWAAPNEQELSTLAALYLSNDLVTIADAAAACNVPIKRISAAVGAGQLRGYINPDAPNPRKGRTLVSLAECRRVWGE